MCLKKPLELDLNHKMQKSAISTTVGNVFSSKMLIRNGSECLVLLLEHILHIPAFKAQDVKALTLPLKLQI